MRYHRRGRDRPIGTPDPSTAERSTSEPGHAVTQPPRRLPTATRIDSLEHTHGHGTIQDRHRLKLALQRTSRQPGYAGPRARATAYGHARTPTNTEPLPSSTADPPAEAVTIPSPTTLGERPGDRRRTATRAVMARMMCRRQDRQRRA